MTIHAQNIEAQSQPHPHQLTRNDASEDRVTILASSFGHAALEFHKRRMADEGYRLESRISGHRFFKSEVGQLEALFDGEVQYAVTFVKTEK